MRRRANIDRAGVLRPHDHVGWFGDGVGELYSVAGAAIADGVRRREKLMFVAEDPDPARLSGVAGLERLLAIGQLELIPVDAVYGTAKEFSASAQLATFEGSLAKHLPTGTGASALWRTTRRWCGKTTRASAAGWRGSS
jgi:MEDS: MEthanogen/methylotroph, DcmR Sensory domain